MGSSWCPVAASAPGRGGSLGLDAHGHGVPGVQLHPGAPSLVPLPHVWLIRTPSSSFSAQVSPPVSLTLNSSVRVAPTDRPTDTARPRSGPAKVRGHLIAPPPPPPPSPSLAPSLSTALRRWRRRSRISGSTAGAVWLFKSPRPNGRCDGPGRRRRTRHLRRQLLAPSIGHAWSCDARKERSSGQSTHPRATRASDAARAAFVSAPGSSRPRKRPRRGGT